jgi:hypothetical protein
MKETDIRDRIAQFLKKTARTVVVPASMGLGLSSTGCEGHSLHGRAADAGPDSGAQHADAPGVSDAPDGQTLAPDLADAATRDDLPLIMVPYLLAMVPDAAAEVAPDVGPASRLDADDDASTLDVRADIAYPPPPYLVPPVALDELPRAPGPAPEKK